MLGVVYILLICALGFDLDVSVIRIDLNIYIVYINIHICMYLYCVYLVFGILFCFVCIGKYLVYSVCLVS